MKILILSPYVGSNYGGIAKVVLNFARELGKAGITVDIVTTNANSTENLSVSLKIWDCQEYYRIQYFPCWYRDDLIFSFSLIYWLHQHITNYDLVHTHTIFSPLIRIAQQICLMRRVPYLSTPHGMLEPWALSYKAYKKRFYYRLLEKPALENARAICSLTAIEAKQVKFLKIQTPTFITPNAIDIQEFTELPSPEIFYQKFPQTRAKNLILFLGRINPKKGLDLLTLAFAKIHQKFPDTHLVVVGPDNINFLPTAQNYFRQEGCLDAVTFTGMLTGEMKYAALAAASLYVAPSYSEGFSISVLEGMASGLPCIITTGCNFPEAGTAEAACVVDIDANAIATALTHCLEHPEQAKIMGDRARKFILENYTWDKIATNLIQIYEAIINQESISARL